VRRIGLVVPNLAGGGGVPAVARFLARAIDRTEDLEVDLVSLATSAKDTASLRLASPQSWKGQPSVEFVTWEGRKALHVGARFVEFEFQRYRPRSALSHVLADSDLVQVVAGSPAYAVVAREFTGPVTLQVATLASVERQEALQRGRGALGLWRRAMTSLTRRMDRAGAAIPERIFVENEWMRLTMSAWVAPERVRLAPPGVDADFFHPDPGGHRGNEEPLYLFSVARFADPRKNVRLLFEAYARLRHRLPACPKLVLAGESAPTPSDWAYARQLGL